MSNYREIPSCLTNREPFDGNSMSARYVANGAYVVYSYATEIARVPSTNGLVHGPEGSVVFNDRKYSRTTSRHQTLCHAHL